MASSVDPPLIDHREAPASPSRHLERTAEDQPSMETSTSSREYVTTRSTARMRALGEAAARRIVAVSGTTPGALIYASTLSQFA